MCCLLPAVYPAGQVAVLYLCLVASMLSVVRAGSEGNLDLCCLWQAMENLKDGLDQLMASRDEKLRMGLWQFPDLQHAPLM